LHRSQLSSAVIKSRAWCWMYKHTKKLSGSDDLASTSIGLFFEFIVLSSENRLSDERHEAISNSVSSMG
jgi:hypothetical protein